MNHLTWKETNVDRLGPVVHYGYWEDAKCFSIYHVEARHNPGFPYAIKCTLPGFRQDLPQQTTIDAAKEMAERMLTRWVAKRGLLFKAHIIVTDAMANAVMDNMNEGSYMDADEIKLAIKAALEARG